MNRSWLKLLDVYQGRDQGRVVDFICSRWGNEELCGWTFRLFNVYFSGGLISGEDCLSHGIAWHSVVE